MKIVLLLFLAAFAGCDAAFGQAANGKGHQVQTGGKWNLCVDVQMVALEQAKALELIPEFLSADDGKVEAACTRLQTMLKSKEATLMAWPMVRLTDGSKACSETIIEKRYPTEIEPPQEPRTFGPAPKKPGPVDEATREGIVNAYEIRNLEVTLEVTGTVRGEGSRACLQLRVWRQQLLESENYKHVLTIHNELVPTAEPLILNLKSDLDLTVQNGQRQLIAIHKPSQGSDTIELHLLRVRITPIQ